MSTRNKMKGKRGPKLSEDPDSNVFTTSKLTSFTNYSNEPGNTPLHSIDRLLYAQRLNRPGLELLVKLESHNPSGSAKERIARFLFATALRSGSLLPGMTVIVPSSGNTGYACAVEASRRGYKIIIVISEDAGEEKILAIRNVGAEVCTTPASQGSDGAYEAASKLAASNPDDYYLLDQYTDLSNPLAHFETTGPEIWNQTNGLVTHFIAPVGTGGTITGTGTYLKQQNPSIQIIGVQPTSSEERIPGMRYIGQGSSTIPTVYDPSAVNHTIYVTLAESMQHVIMCADAIGLGIGPSSGAALAASLQVCRELRYGVVVALLPDGLGKYLSLLPTLLATTGEFESMQKGLSILVGKEEQGE